MESGNAGYLKLRAPTVAGIFYPEGAKEADAAVAALERDAACRIPAGTRKATAVIVPHAGWELSGATATAGVAAAEDREIRTLVIIGPHHQGTEDGIFLSESDYFRTPSADIGVDRELCAELESCGTRFIVNDIPHLEEHAIEVVLPFFAHAFPGASLVPILVRGYKSSLIDTLSRAIDYVFDPIKESTLFVVSTNLCDNRQAPTARAHSDRFMSLLLAGDAEGIRSAIADGSISACGASACAALLRTELVGSKKAELIAASDSTGRPDHDSRMLVRYASIAYF